MVRGIVFNGMRPTSSLHLGNYLGSVVNMIKLQNEYQCFYAIVDWHALTTGYENTKELQTNIQGIALDWLSAGVDPEKCTIFVQSQVKEHAELHLLLSMLTPLGWLERVPTYKDQLRQLQERNIHTYGFLGYPMLMAADILAYKADTVPVGEDQIPHLEFAREVARRFNHLYQPIFPEPDAYLTKTPLLPGIDGRKMSKSYGNDIPMSASPELIQEKVRQMITDPARVRKTDPGNPEICTVAQFYKSFLPAGLEDVYGHCQTGSIGCVACKKRLAQLIIQRMEPIYRRRQELEKRPELVREILNDGAKRARLTATQVIAEVRQAMNV
ncbi:MAG: tryptophan--tRNA ligase [bacterium]|jgi:tryptophanyl-tRNA synthetase